MRFQESPLSELSEYLEFRRGADLEDDSYLYLHEKWYEIVEIAGSRVLGSIAGCHRYDDLGIEIHPDRLYVTIPDGTPVQFRDGQPLGTRWPDKDLIYVEAAYPCAGQGLAVDSEERVRGLFLRTWDVEEGRSCYAALDPTEQGFRGPVVLDEDWATIVSWRPVPVAAILEAVGK